MGLIIGDRIPERIRTIVVQVIGLVTLGLGLGDVLKTHNMVFPLVGMVLGGIVGELLAIERRLEGLGEVIRRRFARNQEPGKFVNGHKNQELSNNNMNQLRKVKEEEQHSKN